MADEFVLTPSPVTLTALGKQPLSQALLVIEYDEAEALLQVPAFSGTNYTLRILTGMQTDTEDGWVVAATYTQQTTPLSQKLNVPGLLKYIRWELSQATGLTSITFYISGVLRTK